MGNLCQSCLCELEISASPIPLCDSCCKELLSLPIEQRMARIAELRKNAMLAELLDSLADLLELSKRYTPYRQN